MTVANASAWAARGEEVEAEGMKERLVNRLKIKNKQIKMPHKKAKNIHAPLLGHLPTHNHPALPPAPFIPPILSPSSLTAAEQEPDQN